MLELLTSHKISRGLFELRANVEVVFQLRPLNGTLCCNNTAACMSLREEIEWVKV